MHWIKAEIHEYILKNWRMVKVATTKAQRKLFFNLRSMKQGLKGEAGDGRHPPRHADAERGRRAGARAQRQARGSARDGNPPVGRRRRARAADGDDGEESFAPIAYLADESSEPTRVLEARHRDWLASDGIARALDVLDARSRRIVEERWLKVNDDGSGGMTLHELAAEYGVSRRAHPPDRGRGDEEDAQGAGAGELTPALKGSSNRPFGACFRLRIIRTDLAFATNHSRTHRGEKHEREREAGPSHADPGASPQSRPHRGSPSRRPRRSSRPRSARPPNRRSQRSTRRRPAPARRSRSRPDTRPSATSA